MKLFEIKKNFNDASKTYNDNSIIQYKIGNYLIDRLKNHNFNFIKEIIDLGCGTAMITANLAKLYPISQKIYAIDISNQLLKEAVKNFSDQKIIFLEENFEEFSDKLRGKKFDLIFSNMALQWSNNFEKNIIYLKDKLSDQAIIAFSITLDGSLRELKKIKKIPLFSFNHILEILKRNNLILIEYQNFPVIDKYDSLKNALRSIKLVGANYSEDKISNIKHLRQLYHEEKGKIEKNFDITYEIGIFIAKNY